jgi:hypothetical protein
MYRCSFRLIGIFDRWLMIVRRLRQRLSILSHSSLCPLFSINVGQET